MRVAVVVTCEHATSHVPRRHSTLFSGLSRELASHRGHDLGAAPVARHLARSLGAPLVSGRVTRLLVDLNRSVGHPGLFSSVSRRLSPDERARVVREYHAPHREAVERAVRGAARDGALVLHFAIHSFTPVLDGERRNADIGLLYDPGRSRERAVAQVLRARLTADDPTLRVRRNYPYRGVSDGLPTALRRQFSATRYAGFEIELNQTLLSPGKGRERVARLLVSAVSGVLSHLGASSGGPHRQGLGRRVR